jgi:hypothetical protein
LTSCEKKILSDLTWPKIKKESRKWVRKRGKRKKATLKNFRTLQCVAGSKRSAMTKILKAAVTGWSMLCLAMLVTSDSRNVKRPPAKPDPGE